MEFRTTFTATPSDLRIRPESRLLLMGSCFSDNIGSILQRLRFSVCYNPMGVVYNPVSLDRQIVHYGLLGGFIEPAELWEEQGVVSHRDFHSQLNQLKKKDYLTHLQSVLPGFRSDLRQTDFFIFTLGTSSVYEWKETDTIVANCHKKPAAQFRKRLLSIQEINAAMASTLRNLLQVNMNAKFIITVSPVRHLRDGMIANNRSKARLLEAAHQLCDEFIQATYFPAYEIMLDDLREYRFYDRDMVHPSKTAIDYIWEKFQDSFFDQATDNYCREMEKVNKAIQHRPFHPASDNYRFFCREQLRHIHQLENKYPHLDLTKEKDFFNLPLS